jgi:hypothetical protein
MKALLHATSKLNPISLRLRYTFGLHGRPSTNLIGARTSASGSPMSFSDSLS